MNNHEDIYEWISRYNEGDLKGEDLKRFLQILASDPEIRADTELDRELTEFFKDRDLLEFLNVLDQVKRNKRQGFGLNCLLLAALLIILVSISGFWAYMNPLRTGHPRIRESVVVTTDVESTQSQGKIEPILRKSPGYPEILIGSDIKDLNLLAANFQPLNYMEGMVGIVTRTGQFNLLSPENMVMLVPGDTIQFHWKNSGETDPSFEVINNRGEIIVSREVIAGGSLTLPTHSWKEGLYYWKFLLQENLVSVGKITIKR